MYLVLIIDHVYILPVLQNVILELDKFLGLFHVARLYHALYFTLTRIYNEALTGKIGIKEASKDHDLSIVYGEGT
jgi:hypothetical protein